MATLIQLQIRIDTAANWSSANTVLLAGEQGYDSTNGIYKIGDGVTGWNSLAPASPPTLIPTGIKTANYTAGPNELVLCDNTAGTFTIEFPHAPPIGTRVAVKTNSANYVVTVSRNVTGGTDVFNQAGGSTTQTLNMQNQVSVWTYYAGVWYQLQQAIAVGQMDLRYLQPTNAVTVTGKTMDTADNTFTGFAWCPEGLLTSGAVVDGYNDLPGGFSVEPGPKANGVYLDSIWIRVGDLATSNSGGDLILDVYGGTKNSQGTLITSITLTNGSQDVVSTLGSPYSLSANAVVRVYLTKGSSTLSKALHCQLRGRYKG